MSTGEWGSLSGRAADAMTAISQVLLPEIKEHMYEGFQHYGDNHNELGVRGQFADIWRKIKPLKRALWDGETLTRESPRQICLDLIGHCLLTILMLDEQAHGSLGFTRDTNLYRGEAGILPVRPIPFRLLSVETDNDLTPMRAIVERQEDHRLFELVMGIRIDKAEESEIQRDVQAARVVAEETIPAGSYAVVNFETGKMVLDRTRP